MAAASAYGQRSATVRGMVTDSSKAAIPRAKPIANQEGTSSNGAVLETHTCLEGGYGWVSDVKAQVPAIQTGRVVSVVESWDGDNF